MMQKIGQKWWLAISTTAALVLLLVFFAGAAELSVHFLDVGQGDSLAIQTPTGDWILIDGGEEPEGRSVVVPYLKSQGAKSLEFIIITHPHSDHIGGLNAVVEAIPVGQVIADGQVHTSRTYERLLTTIDKLNIPFALARRGQVYDIGGGAKLYILHPKEILYDDLNNNSVVARLVYGDVAFLFTGDGEVEMEAELLQTNAELSSTVLKVAHHGSSTSTSEAFLHRVSPRLAVISVGADNRYGHPDMEVLERLDAADVEVLRTDQEGTIVVTTDGQTYLKVASERGTRKFSLSWQQELEKAKSKEAAAYESSPKADVAAAGKININTATLAELDKLPGIGPALAQRIVAYREKHPFKSVDELLEVKGIGSGKLEQIRHLVVVK